MSGEFDNLYSLICLDQRHYTITSTISSLVKVGLEQQNQLWNCFTSYCTTIKFLFAPITHGIIIRLKKFTFTFVVLRFWWLEPFVSSNLRRLQCFLTAWENKNCLNSSQRGFPLAMDNDLKPTLWAVQNILKSSFILKRFTYTIYKHGINIFLCNL